MKFARYSLPALVFFAVALVTLPVLSSAHWGGSQNSQNCTQSGYVWQNGTCTNQNALLKVYVLVMNRDNSNAQPSLFTVSVAGAAATPASFQGSINGVPVTIAGGGSYSVSVVNDFGFTASYSNGCAGTLGRGDNATCVITMNVTNMYSQYPTPYPYPYTTQPLTCAPSYQTVSAGQTATFTALGGNGSYNWKTASQTYLNAGPTLNVVLPSTGTQSVTVSNGSQVAVCSVNVVTGGVAAPYSTVIVSGGATQNLANVTATSYYVPRLPNTGFAPENGAELAFEIVLLLAAAAISYPYARAAFTTVLSR